jgi:catechol 2,3-dioxygenase-like lactoylglutathione lyase family enzyme
MSHTAINVLDQERAKRFYTEVLGFEVRTDDTMDGFRWLTVAPKDQPNLEIVLVKPSPPMYSPEDAAAITRLIEKGTMSGGVLETDDVQRTYEELKAKGVVFLQEPAERPYGTEALFRDDSGNWFSLMQRRA